MSQPHQDTLPDETLEGSGASGAVKRKNSPREELIEWIKAILFAAVIVGVLFGFFIKPVEVIGSSMVPTLHSQDRLIVWKFCYEPQNGDPVILSENTGLDEALVKRVIAVAGQTVDIDPDGAVLVDGQRLEETYIAEPIDDAHRGDWEYPVTVPEGCIFVMGDNRNASTDSRFYSVGFVDTDEVIGKVVLRILPLNAIGLVH